LALEPFVDFVVRLTVVVFFVAVLRATDLLPRLAAFVAAALFFVDFLVGFLVAISEPLM